MSHGCRVFPLLGQEFASSTEGQLCKLCNKLAGQGQVGDSARGRSLEYLGSVSVVGYIKVYSPTR